MLKTSGLGSFEKKNFRVVFPDTYLLFLGHFSYGRMHIFFFLCRHLSRQLQNIIILVLSAKGIGLICKMAALALDRI